MIRRIGEVSYKVARRIAVAVIGGTILLGGIVMLITPGPGVLIVLMGLAILAIEFAWAKIWLDKVRHSVSSEGRNELRSHFARVWARWFGERG